MEDEMALYFINHYPAALWIAFVYFDAGCGGTQFRKTGWWQVNPGETFNAWNTDLRTVNRFASFYAEEFKIPAGPRGAEPATAGIASPIWRSINVTMIIQIATNSQISFNWILPRPTTAPLTTST
jgi:hypothetical protein